MLERFIEIIVPIRKALIELPQLPILIYTEILLLQDVVCTLKPVRLVVDAINRTDLNLLSCDAALRFMSLKLQPLNNPIALSLLKNTEKYINDRMLQTAVDSLAFLRDPTNNSSSGVIRFLIQLAKRLDLQDADEEDKVKDNDEVILVIHDDVTEQRVVIRPVQPTLQEELEAFLSNATSPIPPKLTLANALDKTLLKEIDIFKDNGTKGIILDRLEKALLTVKLTSIEPERCFSNAAQLCTKLLINM